MCHCEDLRQTKCGTREAYRNPELDVASLMCVLRILGCPPSGYPSGGEIGFGAGMCSAGVVGGHYGTGSLDSGSLRWRVSCSNFGHTDTRRCANTICDIRDDSSLSLSIRPWKARTVGLLLLYGVSELPCGERDGVASGVRIVLRWRHVAG